MQHFLQADPSYFKTGITLNNKQALLDFARKKFESIEKACLLAQQKLYEAEDGVPERSLEGTEKQYQAALKTYVEFSVGITTGTADQLNKAWDDLQKAKIALDDAQEKFQHQIDAWNIMIQKKDLSAFQYEIATAN